MEPRPRFVACDAVRVNGSGNGEQARIRDAAEDHFTEPGAIDMLPKPTRKRRRGRQKKKFAPVKIHTFIILIAMYNKFSRRSLLGAAFLASLPPDAIEAMQEHEHTPVGPAQRQLQHFDAATAAEIERLAGEIIPADDLGPGAKEAGVVYFIDRALATFDGDKRTLYREGLAAAHGKPAAAIEHTEFFEMLRRHVIMGFLASPEWGGNRDKCGWKLIGFADAGSFQPPFGYYDAPEHRE